MLINSLLKKLVIDDEFNEKVGFLMKVSLFSGLGRKALITILSIIYEKNYNAGEIVFEEGKPGKALYIVKSGEIAIVKNDKTIFTLGPGDFLGEMALLEEIPRTATARVNAPSKLLLIYKVKFDGMLESSPSVGIKIIKNLAKILCARLRHTSQGFAEVLDPAKAL